MSNFIIEYKKNVRKVLNFVFGEQGFFDLYNFFLNVFLKLNPDIVVFTTRRAHVLFSLFKFYVFSDDDVKKTKINDILCIDDKSINTHKVEISRAKSIVVVDDILIHGRALDDVVHRLQQVNSIQIKKAVFIISDETGYEVEYYVHRFNRKLWKQFSNKIVSALILSSVPYASYLYSFFMPLSASDFETLKEKCFSLFSNSSLRIDAFELDLSLQEVDNETKFNREINKNIKAYIFPLNNNEFLRIYYNKYTQLLYVIPTVFLDSYTKEEIEELYDGVFSSKRLKRKMSECGPETKYRLLSAYFSYNLIDKYDLKSKLQIEFNDEKFVLNKNNRKIIDMSFYDGCYDDLANTNGTFHDFKQIDKKFSTFTELVEKYKVKTKYKNEPIYRDVYLDEFLALNANEDKVIFGAHSNYTNMIYEYLKNVDIQEEKVLNDCLSTVNLKTSSLLELKQRGLSFVFIEYLSEKMNIPVFKIYSCIVAGADTGLITFYADSYSIDNVDIYSNFLITGEQVCRLYQNKYLIVALCLKKFYERVKSKYIVNMKYMDFVGECIKSCEHFKQGEHLMKLASYVEEVDSFTFEFLLKSIYEGINNKELRDLLDNAFLYLE